MTSFRRGLARFSARSAQYWDRHVLSAVPKFRQLPRAQNPSSQSEAGVAHGSSGHAQSSALSASSGHTSLPTILTAAADAGWAIPCQTVDEQVINDSLMNLLEAPTINVPEVDCRWTSARRPFGTVSFGHNQMTACADGYLEGQHIREIFAIVEVKAAQRDRKARPNVLWQDSGGGRNGSVDPD
ncbi:hypothetical protein N7517_004832 [Penicillium concentricum]|uniref:Uncharacterized protein n=1 Tax=Penicillium concentricum TaxID=293559 RepID=A0A9W9S6A2_9EURO|nr:uncharacterized protein N7517_004832 [Penicillium concentricum]KAJ5372826.1 hypothetical protein N7517_004832 [Penicillium concentricum]